jgi:hypothetical protein
MDYKNKNKNKNKNKRRPVNVGNNKLSMVFKLLRRVAVVGKRKQNLRERIVKTKRKYSLVQLTNHLQNFSIIKSLWGKNYLGQKNVDFFIKRIAIKSFNKKKYNIYKERKNIVSKIFFLRKSKLKYILKNKFFIRKFMWWDYFFSNDGGTSSIINRLKKRQKKPWWWRDGGRKWEPDLRFWFYWFVPKIKPDLGFGVRNKKMRVFNFFFYFFSKKKIIQNWVGFGFKRMYRVWKNYNLFFYVKDRSRVDSYLAKFSLGTQKNNKLVNRLGIKLSKLFYYNQNILYNSNMYFKSYRQLTRFYFKYKFNKFNFFKIKWSVYNKTFLNRFETFYWRYFFKKNLIFRKPILLRRFVSGHIVERMKHRKFNIIVNKISNLTNDMLLLNKKKRINRTGNYEFRFKKKLY